MTINEDHHEWRVKDISDHIFLKFVGVFSDMTTMVLLRLLVMKDTPQVEKTNVVVKLVSENFFLKTPCFYISK